MNVKRIHRPDLSRIWTSQTQYALHNDQTFYTTSAAYEIWDVDPKTGEALKRVHRIPAKKVLWEFSKP